MKKSIDLVFLWHMHQPDYRDYSSGDFVLPWTYLHAIKDYTDMAYHLERHPKIRAVLNFVPILVDQLEDYVDQFASGILRDPLLRLLSHTNLNELTADQRELVLSACFRCNYDKMVEPFPAYKNLMDIHHDLQDKGDAVLSYLSGQYMADLITWYHLAWCGESVRRQYPLVVRLMQKGDGYTYQDRKELLDLIGQLIAGIIPRYRKLAKSGQIEISATPHYHPLAPLMIDFASALEAMPDAPLPESAIYPGGKERVAQHIAKAKKSHATRFGSEPKGMWPAEGSISNETLAVMAEEGCHWTASGQTVLVNSLRHNHLPTDNRTQYLYRPYKLAGAAGTVSCFFRDDNLSDLIGFEYARWDGRDAARHFVAQVADISKHTVDAEAPIVSVILDGENAWEYYPYNGFYFLDQLYTELENHIRIHTSTFSDYLKLSTIRSDCAKTKILPSIVAGSWVYGNFSTWIGCKDKNLAWDLLCAAKASYDDIMLNGTLSPAEKIAAEQQLCSCESSDWFWWFGDYNPSLSVASFDRLYRHNLRELYRLIKLPAPHNLFEPVSLGNVNAEVSGAMRRASEAS